MANNLGISNFRVSDNNSIRIYETQIPQSKISKALILNDIVVEAINKKNSSLEEYFMKILNGGGVHA